MQITRLERFVANSGGFDSLFSRRDFGQRFDYPTQAKGRLEWATTPPIVGQEWRGYDSGFPKWNTIL